MDEYSNAEEQITKQVFETLNTCPRGDAENAAVLQQKNTKKQGFWDVLEGVISGGYKAGKDFVEGIVDLVTDPVETIENTFNAILHPIDTYNYISKAISDSYERDVINGDAKSRAEWFSYAITTIGLSVVGTKGVSSVSKTGMASTKVAIQSGANKIKAVGEKISNLNLLPYAPRNQLAYAAAGTVPYNVMNGNRWKDQLLSMVEMEAKDTHNGTGKDKEFTQAKFKYKNNPMNNPKAAKDIIENPAAVYGFSPKKGGRLDDFVDMIDWTDAEQVASARAQRKAYHNKMINNLESKVKGLLDEGYSMDDIAKNMVNERNQNRIDSYIKNGNYEGLEGMYKSNLKEYGNAEGPTYEYMLKKYGSNEEIINSSIKSNLGMDACTGLYDEYFKGGN